MTNFSKVKTIKHPYRISWNKYGSADQFITALADLISSPIRNMHEMDGDMYVSDYSKLLTAGALLANRDEIIND